MDQRKASAKALEVISQTIRYLISKGVRSCLWMTITFPPEAKGRKERERRYTNWRKAVVNCRGWKALAIPEQHASGEIHFHIVLYVPGAEFETGFDHKARQRWVSGRGNFDKILWMRSANAELRAMWKERKLWGKLYGLGHVDICPFRTDTDPMAVARYIASYAGQGQHPKGTRVVRRIGWKKGAEKPLVNNRAWRGVDGDGDGKVYVDRNGDPHRGPVRVVSAFSLIGENCSIFGKLKMLGDNGKRGRGWAVKAVVQGFGIVCSNRFSGWVHNYLDTLDVVIRCLGILSRSPVRMATGAHKETMLVCGLFD